MLPSEAGWNLRPPRVGRVLHWDEFFTLGRGQPWVPGRIVEQGGVGASRPPTPLSGTPGPGVAVFSSAQLCPEVFTRVGAVLALPPPPPRNCFYAGIPLV